MAPGIERSFTGKLKAASNRGVKLYGMCAANHCKLESTSQVDHVPLCSFHLTRVADHGTITNPCHGPSCDRLAVKILGPVGHMLCKSHAHQRFVLGVNGAWEGWKEPTLRALDPIRITAFGKRSMSPLDQFMLEVAGDHDTGCWNWTGSVNGKRGSDDPNLYGRFWLNNDPIPAHVWAWINIAGLSLIDGLVIDHMCENKMCVRPGHLQQITNADNLTMGKTRRQPPPPGMVVVPPRGNGTVQAFIIAEEYDLPRDIGIDPTVIVEPFTG